MRRPARITTAARAPAEWSECLGRAAALNAQMIANLIKQCVRLSAWSIFQAIWGVMNKLISIKAMKYKLFYRLGTLTMHITPMFRVSTLRRLNKGE